MARKTQNAKTSDNKNLGLSILIAFMSFEVIIEKEWNAYSAVTTGALGWLFYLRIAAIPVLVMLTFYSFQRKLVSKNGSEIWDKVLRLVIPIVGWAVIYWLSYLLMMGTLEDEGRPIGGRDFIQLCISGSGGSLNPVMWVLIGSVILTVFFLLFILVAPKFYNVVFIVLTVLALVVQYIGLNVGKYVSFMGISDVIDYLPEMLGLAAVGFLIASYGVTAKTGAWWPITMLVAVAVICLLRYFGIFTDITGFGYAGIKIIVLSLALILLFAAPPLAKLPKFMHVIINWLTRYALGVFCINRLISYLLNYAVQHRNWVPIESDSIFYSILVYVISYVIVLLISLIPCKWTRMLVQND